MTEDTYTEDRELFKRSLVLLEWQNKVLKRLAVGLTVIAMLMAVSYVQSQRASAEARRRLIALSADTNSTVNALQRATGPEAQKRQAATSAYFAESVGALCAVTMANCPPPPKP